MSGSTTARQARRRPPAALSERWAVEGPACAGLVYAVQPIDPAGLVDSILPVPTRGLHNSRNGGAATAHPQREPRARNAALIHTTITGLLASVLRQSAAVRVVTVRPTNNSSPRVRPSGPHAADRPHAILAAAAPCPWSLDTTTSTKRRRRSAILSARRAAFPTGARRAILVPTATNTNSATSPRRVLLVAAAPSPPAGVRGVLLVASASNAAGPRRFLRVAASTDGAVEVAAS